MKTLLSLFFAPLLVYLLSLNLRLYHSPEFSTAPTGFVNKEVQAQLGFLQAELRAGAGEKMQQFFPEGFIFINVLYGLAWCNQLENSGKAASPLWQEGQWEVAWALEQLRSPAGELMIAQDLPLRGGAFYNGWVGYLEGKRLSLQAPVQRDTAEVRRFQERCRRMGAAFAAAPSPWLESYHGQSWPGDNLLCIAALSLHDRLFAPEFQTLIQDWLPRMRTKTDPFTGLIPHAVRPDGSPLEGARGCSQSLGLIFLPEIDPAFAAEQYALFQKIFPENLLTLPGIREYPKGKQGEGDVDSGPVLFGMGGAASIVAVAACRQNGDIALSQRLRNEVEGLGFPLNLGGKKRYFFGVMPMADAFIAWVNSFQRRPDKLGEVAWNRWRFHGVSVLISLLFWVMWRFFVR